MIKLSLIAKKNNFGLVRPRSVIYVLSGSQAGPFIRPRLRVDFDEV